MKSKRLSNSATVAQAYQKGKADADNIRGYRNTYADKAKSDAYDRGYEGKKLK